MKRAYYQMDVIRMLMLLVVASSDCWAGEAADACSDHSSVRITVDQGHSWRPPFGLDRVGAPIVARVNMIADLVPGREYVLIGYRNGRQIEQHALQLSEPKSPFFATAQFKSLPEQVALVARCVNEQGLQEVQRQSVSWPEIEADAEARPNQQINPVDLGAILVPQDWLLLAGRQRALIGFAAFSRIRDFPNARLRAWFDTGKTLEVPVRLTRNKRYVKTLELPLSGSGERDVLHVALTEEGRELWRKDIPTMLVAKRPNWPGFGAVQTKLRYDAPVLVTDPRNAAPAFMDYDTAWSPELNDVVVFLPNGSRFVFWRGASYAPFWAGPSNTGFSYTWAETLPPHDSGIKVTLEPLQDKELRYSRVRIVENTPSRIHVRWTYQMNDPQYRVFGDQASEDFYFYPDGFGTRVLTLSSAPGADYVISEFDMVAPQGAYPLEMMPNPSFDLLYLDGENQRITFPYRPPTGQLSTAQAPIAHRRNVPILFRARFGKEDRAAAIYFSPLDRPQSVFAFTEFYDRGEMVSPAYWGSHWPLNQGNPGHWSIDSGIDFGPSSTAWIDWGLMSRGNQPTPLATTEGVMPDALGRSRTVMERTWAWLIANTDASAQALLNWARSYAAPPSLEMIGARMGLPSYSMERRALRLIAESSSIHVVLKPAQHAMNPVFEIEGAPPSLASVTLDGKALSTDAYAWDGTTLWIKASIGVDGATIDFQFQDARQ